MHLDMAEKIRAHAALPSDVAAQLDAAWPSFYLGSVAADFQTISNVPREATHFYPLPPDPDDRAYPRMFAANPSLRSAETLTSEQAVFVAAYITHLLLDLRWFHEILVPFFVVNPQWGDAGRKERFTSHNVLLTYMDREALSMLPDSAEVTLRHAPTANMAPFISADDLMRWRDMIADQLQPDGLSRTVEIFAGRLGMTPDAFAANLDNPDWMQAQLFDRVPFAAVQNVFAHGLDDSVTLVADYLQGKPV